MKRFASLMVVIVGLAMGGVCRVGTALPIADPDKYWDMFNVYSLGNIGTSTNPYTSDFQGVAGAGGDAFFHDFELNILSSGQPWSLYTSGGSYVSNGTYHGGIQSAGDVHLDGVTVFGDVRSGGGVYAGMVEGNTILGNVFAQEGGAFANYTVSQDVHSAGNLDMTEGTVAGDVHNEALTTFSNGTVLGTLYYKDTPPVVTASTVGGPTAEPGYVFPADTFFDHAAASAHFAAMCDEIAAMPDQGATLNVVYGPDGKAAITIEAVSGINVVHLAEADFLAAWTIGVTGPPDAIVYVNVALSPGGAAFGDIDWWTSGGMPHSNVVMNFPDANAIEMFGSYFPSMLMPYADLTYTNGLLTGTLVAASLMGDGQVNLPDDPFDPGGEIPEPATLLLFLSALVAAACRRRGKRGA